MPPDIQHPSRRSRTAAPATLFLLGSSIFLIWGFVSKWTFGSSSLDIQVHDTYLVIKYRHLAIFFALIFGVFFIVYFNYRRIVRRTLNEPMGYIHFVLTLIVFVLLCWPVHYEGLARMPRTYMDYSGWINIWRPEHMNAGIILIVFTFAQLLFLFNLVYSAFRP